MTYGIETVVFNFCVVIGKNPMGKYTLFKRNSRIFFVLHLKQQAVL